MSVKTRALLVSIVLICTMIVLFCNWTVDYADLPDDDYQDYQTTVRVSLILYAPMLLDAVVEYCLQKNTAKEFSWPIQLFVAVIPNIFIYWRIIVPGLIPLVMYFQHTCLILLQEYRIQRLSSFQGVESKDFGKFFVFLVAACVFACLYNLTSTVDTVTTRPIIKGFTAFLTLTYHCVIIKGACDLIKESLKPTCIIRYVESARAMFISNLVILLSASFVPFVDLIFYGEERILFPSTMDDNFILESLLIVSTTLTFLIRNYENRLIVLSCKNDLDSSRKMTRSISHEIRTPLNTAFMALELLKDGMQYPKSDEKEADRLADWLETVDNVRQACDVALGILNQLLTFDKLSSKMLQLERKLVPVLHILECNTKLFRMQALQSGLNFKVEISQDEKTMFGDILFFVDEPKLNQVIRNLLSNAMKFTPKRGTVMVRIALESSERENSDFSQRSVLHATSSSLKSSFRAVSKKISAVQSRVSSYVDCFGITNNAAVTPSSSVNGAKCVGVIRISIIDSGPGVEKEDQAKLFQEYVQINPGELQKGQGSGLGLSISKSIVTMHGGNIGMYSQGKNKGSTFYIELPAYRLPKSSSDNVLFSDLSNNEDYDHVSFSNTNIQATTHSTSQPRRESLAKIVPLSTGDSSEDPDDVTQSIGKGIAGSLDSNTDDHDNDGDVNDVSKSATTQILFDRKSAKSSKPQKYKTKRGDLLAQGLHSLPKCYNILIVDDSDANRKMLGRLLSREGHVILQAKDGVEAVAIMEAQLQGGKKPNSIEDGITMVSPYAVSEHSSSVTVAQQDFDIENGLGKYTAETSPIVDIILMDNFMIEMNGPEAAAAIRGLGFRGPILGVTGCLDEDADSFMRSGVDVVLQKPIEMQSVWKALKSVGFI